MATTLLMCLLMTATGQPNRKDWWTKEARSMYVVRTSFDAVTPTGFLDDFGSVPLTIASSSASLRDVIRQGGYQVILKPDQKRAELLLSQLEKMRGGKGWDMACEVLRVQLLAETKRDLMGQVVTEIRTESFKSNATCAFGTMLLQRVAARRKSPTPFVSLQTEDLMMAPWRNWSPTTEPLMDQQTIVCFATLPFGSPRSPILGAILRTRSQEAIEWGMHRLWASLAKAKIDPSSVQWERSKPPALRAPSAQELLEAASRNSDQNPTRQAPALTTFLTARVLDIELQYLKYGERFLKTATKQNAYFGAVKNMVAGLKSRANER